MPVKQVRDCQIGGILLYENEKSRIITDIDRRGESYIFCTTDLAGENFRCDLYDAPDEINSRGTQRVLFR